jgi:hypothetical protein
MVMSLDAMVVVVDDVGKVIRYSKDDCVSSAKYCCFIIFLSLPSKMCLLIVRWYCGYGELNAVSRCFLKAEERHD